MRPFQDSGELKGAGEGSSTLSGDQRSWGGTIHFEWRPRSFFPDGRIVTELLCERQEDESALVGGLKTEKARADGRGRQRLNPREYF